MARIRRWAGALGRAIVRIVAPSAGAVGRAIRSPAARWAAGVAIVAGAAAFAIWGLLNLPFLDVGELALVNDVARRMEIRLEYRKGWFAALGGVVVVAGLMVAGWRSAAAMKQAKATEQGNITERFTRAIDQLGARHPPPENWPNVEVRMGALYALEQIANDDPRNYHRQVVEIVTAYLREHAKEHRLVERQLPEDLTEFLEQHGKSANLVDDKLSDDVMAFLRENDKSFRLVGGRLREDVAVAVGVIRRRSGGPDSWRNHDRGTGHFFSTKFLCLQN